MNHLAHLLLSPADPLQRVGNLLGDFARGLDAAALPAPVQQGIALHRAIDRFTDAHPLFRRSRARVGPTFRRWSAVLVDVFWDHCLAREWDRFGDGRPLEGFTGSVYQDLLQHRPLLPEPLRTVLPRMIDDDWLGRSRDRAGIRQVLLRLRRRLRRDAPLDLAVADLDADAEGFARDFAAFFPEVRAFAAVVAANPAQGPAAG